MGRFLFAAIGLLLLSCTRDRSVVKIGDYTLTEKQVRYRNEIIKVYSPDEKRELGEEQLARAYTYAQILKNHGRPVTQVNLDEEEARIDRETAAPELLTKIKAIFGRDHEAYQNVFVLPTYAERTIYYGFFLTDPTIHAESRATAEKFLSGALKNPSSFSGAVPFRVSLERGVLPSKETPPNPHGVPTPVLKRLEEGNAQVGRKWVDEVIRPLKPGQIFPKVMDQGDLWQVVRYLKPEKGKKDIFLLEAVSFPKVDYGSWLKREKGKIPVTK